MTHRPRRAGRLTVFGLNASGLVMLLSLPGLWVAWEPWVLWAVAGAGVLAACLHCALLWLEPEPSDGPPGRPGHEAEAGDVDALRESDFVRQIRADAMAFIRRPAVQWLVRFGLNASGLVMLLSFPATWVAWVPGSLWIVAIAGLSSACLHCGLLWLEDDSLDNSGPDPGKTVPILDVARLHHAHVEQERAA